MMLSKLIEQQMEEDMQKGYDYMFMGNSVAASQEWTKVWEAILLQIDEQRYESIEQLDGDFNGQQSIYNWASDYECELSNAAWEAIDFAQKRIDFCEGYIARVKDKNDYNALGMRGAIAESYSRLGQFEKSDALFMQYLTETPAWGMGWIQWSRLYMEDSYLTCIGKETPSEAGEKAISILEQALLVENLEDRNQVLSVLSETYLSLGLLTEGKKVEVQLRQFRNASKTIKNEAKIGRNSPCPCGSNKKFKKCCGAV